MLQSESSRKKRANTASVSELEARAKQWAALGGIGRSAILLQASQAYDLYLDFLRYGLLGTDFTRWLARTSGVSYSTCHRRLRAGRSLATGSKRNRNQSGLIAELRDRELAAAHTDDWGDDQD